MKRPRHRFNSLPLASALALMILAPKAWADVQGYLRVTEDSDSFSEQLATIGWRGSEGLGVRAGSAHYSAPGWQRTGALLLSTYETRRDASQLEFSAGLVSLAHHTHAIGHLDYLHHLHESTRLGLSLERHYVDSQRSIESGVTFNHAALVLEHGFTPQLELGASLGEAHFSDGNVRSQLRTRWTYELAPESGRYLYLKTRHYENSRPYRTAYFSPQRLSEVSLGVARKARLAPGLVFAAEADYGQQDTESASRPLWGVALALSSPRNHRLNWRVAVQWSNAASSASAGSDYRHTSLTAQITIPF